VQWSVVLEAPGDRVLTREEVVELADAVAAHSGVASGIGTASYAAQVLVKADTREEAAERGVEVLTRAAQVAGLPAWPVSAVLVTGPDDEDME
jgi:hypothetical protein